MSLSLCLLLLCGLVFWIAVAWAMLAAMPQGELDWFDQLAFALWPITIFGLIIDWAWHKAFPKRTSSHIEALDLRKPPAAPANCQGCDAAATPGDDAHG